MLAKLRISNEDKFNEVYFSDIANEIFIEVYNTLITNLKNNNVKKQINTNDCVFKLTGFDPKTNTYYYKMENHLIEL